MTKVYANLIGKWCDLSSDPNCKMGSEMKSPDIWWEENALIASPKEISKRSPSLKIDSESLYSYDYISINYEGKDYRINPIFIQIVEG